MAARSRSAVPIAFVALLRGINVGGKNKLPMKAVVELWGELGAVDVRTYIQSGNVVYRLDRARAEGFAERASSLLSKRFGLSIPLVIREAQEFARVAAIHPLAAGADPKALHVAFLATRPASSRSTLLDPERSPPDRFLLSGNEIYLCCPNGMARTKLTNAYFDRALETTSTVRNWATVVQLWKMTQA